MKTSRSSYIINSAFLDVSKQTLSSGSAVKEKDLRPSLSKIITIDFFLVSRWLDKVTKTEYPFLQEWSHCPVLWMVGSIIQNIYWYSQSTFETMFLHLLWGCEGWSCNVFRRYYFEFFEMMILGHFKCNCKEICWANRTTVTLANLKDARRKQRVGKKNISFSQV